MRRIDVGYAIIYIDDDGDTLKEDDTYCFCTTNMLDDYYGAEGHLQWNFYLIIPADLIDDINKIEEIENNDKYFRKYVVNRNMIDEYVAKNYPPMKEQMGKFMLIEGNSWIDATSKLLLLPPEKGMVKIASKYRDQNMMDTLFYLDELRTILINDPDKIIVYYTHITNEISIAKKKFKLFLVEPNF